MQMIDGILPHHQQFMLAVRREMGWPLFKPANDCLGFSSGRSVDVAIGSELARLSGVLRKDLIYTGWASSRARRPLGFTVVFRELLTVDIVSRVVPWCASPDEPVVFVSTRGDDFFAVDRRGTLARLPGRPRSVARGRQLAMRRIVATAATMEAEPLAGNRFVAPGGPWIEPDVPVETVARFA